MAEHAEWRSRIGSTINAVLLTVGSLRCFSEWPYPGTEGWSSWESHEWDEVWVQIRREREGEAWEAVNCNVTGQDSFTVDETIWSLMDENLQVDQNNVYVAFQRTGEELTADGQKVQTATRAMAMGVIQD